MTFASADLVYAFQPTVPPGTARATPYQASLAIPAVEVRAIRWSVPIGPSGVMGFAIGVSGQPVIPLVANTWIVADNETETLEVDDLPPTGAWTFHGYNTGTNPHSVYLRFYCAPLTVADSVADVLRPFPLHVLRPE